jgi:hypothetical protein
MSEDREYLKIEIPVEEDQEIIHRADTTRPSVSHQLQEAGQRLAETAREAWESDTRRNATETLRERTATAAASGRQAVERAVTTQAANSARRTATTGVAKGLFWLSDRLEGLANWVSERNQKNPPDLQQ